MMRKTLKDLFSNTVIYQYTLPDNNRDIDKTLYSTESDYCYKVSNNDNFVNLIYNSIIEYSFGSEDINEAQLQGYILDELIPVALERKMKFSSVAKENTKLSYVFYGEVILYILLRVVYGANALISRGYFFNILENGETKGYDSYHIVSDNDSLELWFGEAKFYKSYVSAIKSVMKNIQKALSNDYLKNNVYAILQHSEKLENNDTVFSDLLKKIKYNTEVNVIDLINDYNMVLVYPVLIVTNKAAKDYDESIEKFIRHINTKYLKREISISVKYRVFFVFLPIDNVEKVKRGVLKCIENNQKLLD